MTRDHMYIVVPDQISSSYYALIYTYNTTTYQFDPPANPTRFSTASYLINYASLSEDKNYLAVSSNAGMYLYGSPLSSPTFVQSSQSSTYHKFSKDGKYLILAANRNIEIIINCDYDPGTIYDNNTLSCVTPPCAANCQTCVSET